MAELAEKIAYPSGISAMTSYQTVMVLMVFPSWPYSGDHVGSDGYRIKLNGESMRRRSAKLTAMEISD